MNQIILQARLLAVHFKYYTLFDTFKTCLHTGSCALVHLHVNGYSRSASTTIVPLLIKWACSEYGLWEVDFDGDDAFRYHRYLEVMMMVGVWWVPIFFIVSWSYSTLLTPLAADSYLHYIYTALKNIIVTVMAFSIRSDSVDYIVLFGSLTVRHRILCQYETMISVLIVWSQGRCEFIYPLRHVSHMSFKFMTALSF